MQKINNAVDGACRKLGLKKGQRKSPRDCCFTMRALGLTGMQVASINKKDSQNAVSKLIDIWSRDQALTVVLTVSAKRGVKVTDKKRNELFAYKMFDIANCTVHREFPEVFVFTGGCKDCLNCHAFYCSDAMQAEALCLAMSCAFQAAFEAWMKLSERKKLKDLNENGPTTENHQNERKVSLGPSEQEDGISSLRSKIAKGRRPSTISNVSAFSFNSHADEVFQGLLAVNEEEESLDDVLLRRASVDWGEIRQDEDIQLKMLGEEVTWDDDTHSSS